MAFSRSFKNQIWHIQLATGEVATSDADRLERAFRCGLVDGRTLVRSSTAPAWQPLSEAAGLEPADMPTGSIPESTEVLSDQTVAPNWKVRDEDVDPRYIRGSRLMPLSMVGGLLTLIALIGVGVTARADTGPAEHAMTQSIVAPPPVAQSSGPHGSHDTYRRLHDGNRFDRAEIQRLREIDYVHRMQGFANKNTRWHVVSPSIKAFTPPPSYRPGSTPNAASRWDPLNGDL